MNRRRDGGIARCALVLAALLATSHVFAQSSQPQQSAMHASARIEGQAVSNNSGRIAINQASGAGNAQANLATIALAPNGLAASGAQSLQSTTIGSTDINADASIAGTAFSGTTGALAVNQAAGSGNQQVNAIAFGQGASSAIAITSVMDAVLAQTAGATSTEGTEAVSAVRHARIDVDAFRGGRGVVQVNQTAGVGNLSTNAIVLQLPVGTP